MNKDFSKIKLCKDCKYFEVKVEACGRESIIEFDPVFGETSSVNFRDCKTERVDVESLKANDESKRYIEWVKEQLCTLEAQFFEPR